VTRRLPPHAFFLVSAVFHYLGPACAVLLFARVDAVGVAWLRIASAAAVFAAWRRPWRLIVTLPWSGRRLLLGLGVVLAVMNTTFYLAIARLPLSTVGAIEFLGPIALAALGARSRRNVAALALAVGGVALLTRVRLEGQPLGLALAFANAALFVLYVVLAHRVAQWGAGIDGLAAAMLVALVVVTPVGLAGAAPALTSPALLAAGAGVGVASSVVPYVTDQLAMARLSRAAYALLLSLTVKRIAVDRLQPACLPVLLLRVHVILSLHGRAAGGGVGGRRCRRRRRTRHRRCGGRLGAGGPGRLPGPPHHRAGASTRRQPGAGCWRRRWCWRSPWTRPCPPPVPPPASPLFAVREDGGGGVLGLTPGGPSTTTCWSGSGWGCWTRSTCATRWHGWTSTKLIGGGRQRGRPRAPGPAAGLTGSRRSPASVKAPPVGALSDPEVHCPGSIQFVIPLSTPEPPRGDGHWSTSRRSH
jgi:inner membrane transporter RhtA